MKRSTPINFTDRKTKIKQSLPPPPSSAASVFSDENLLYEILKHVDAKTLGVSACVSKQWSRTANDERLWELICTKHCANIGCDYNQLRVVVLALGGFRFLHSRYLLPLSKPKVSLKTSSSCYTVAAATSSSLWPCLPAPRMIAPAKGKSCWGKDEIQLSLSLLSVRYFEKLNYTNRKK
ncbi:hypothetical protein QVD17_02389 [Tagetes erecta]|uniref:F-box protein GID2 n=1 Tax=Tagetes erecta TaxID=13708 RepID=A0AAD8P926_TARER|nr:hypothetical protein QVD17_02389 [Tagetes erecta]